MKQLPDPTRLRRWLKWRIRFRILEWLFIGFFATLIGAMLSVFTYAFCLVAAFCGWLALSGIKQTLTGAPPVFSLEVICDFALLLLVLLFFEHRLIHRRQTDSSRWRDRMASMHGLFDILQSLITNPDGSGNLVADLLLAGPRLIKYAVLGLQRAMVLSFANEYACAETLAILAGKFRRTSLKEMTRLAGGHDPMPALRVLQELDCLLFLVAEPPGVILTADTRRELYQAVGFQFGPEPSPAEEEPEPQPQPEFESEPAEEPAEDLAYYELLGVSPQASLAEIKSAYRSRIKQCHPDKFAGRGAEFRQMAEEHAKALNEAYRVLSNKHEARAE